MTHRHQQGDLFVVHMTFVDETRPVRRDGPHRVGRDTLLVYLRTLGEADVFLTSDGHLVQLHSSYRHKNTFAHPLGETHDER